MMGFVPKQRLILIPRKKAFIVAMFLIRIVPIYSSAYLAVVFLWMLFIYPFTNRAPTLREILILSALATAAASIVMSTKDAVEFNEGLWKKRTIWLTCPHATFMKVLEVTVNRWDSNPEGDESLSHEIKHSVFCSGGSEGDDFNLRSYRHYLDAWIDILASRVENDVFLYGRFENLLVVGGDYFNDHDHRCVDKWTACPVVVQVMCDVVRTVAQTVPGLTRKERKEYEKRLVLTLFLEHERLVTFGKRPMTVKSR